MDETKENGENMFFKVKLAELVIGVKCLYGETKDFCREYLTDEESQDFNVAISRKNIEAECKRHPTLIKNEMLNVILVSIWNVWHLCVK